MKVHFYGVRGSIPTPGRDTAEIGGNTACVLVENNNDIVILDGGSGLRVLGQDLMKRWMINKEPLEMSIFFSHVHWDHIQGIPFFAPMFIKGNKITMYGEKKARISLAETLKGQQQYPNFPITIEEVGINGADLNFIDLVAGTYTQVGSMKVDNTKLSHPDGVFCYCITNEKFFSNVGIGHTTKSHNNEPLKKIVYATDTEHRNVLDPRLLKIAKDADILIYDAQYTPEEYAGNPPPAKFDWGHSTYEMAIDTAIAANIKTVILFHHDPNHNDAKVREIESLATKRASNRVKVVTAYEGLEIEI